MIHNLTIVDWQNGEVVLLDQTELPSKEIYRTYSSYQSLAQAIRDMIVRGAPAIGVTAAFGMALASQESKADNFEDFLIDMHKAAETLHSTRPTAINLRWALDHMLGFIEENRDSPLIDLKALIIKETQALKEQDIQENQKIGEHGQSLLKDGDTILTHCNAGALATAGFGTALGVVYAAKNAGKNIQVYADETRPFLQGARLTSWELTKSGIPTTVITDNSASFVLQKNKIDKIIVGADRIAANGDVANKIGTYNLAVLAQFHKIPMYVAAPLSTFDMKIKSGNDIPIEFRHENEIRFFNEKEIVAKQAKIENPAFDVTPNHLISAIITNKGVIEDPSTENLSCFLNKKA